jgi:hypothetical protein
MYKRLSNPEEPHLTALQILVAATQQYIKKPKPKKNQATVALGRHGGKNGGKSRAEALTPKQRKGIALLTAKTRWNKAHAN